MTVTLVKGGNVSLTQADPGMKKIAIGLGWDARATNGGGFDLDASMFILKEDGKVRGDSDFIFYNNLRSTDGSVEHTGDNTTGIGEGDDESINVNLDFVPAEVQRMVVGVTIHDAEANRVNFGMVSNAFVRVLNRDTNVEIVRYDLSEDFSTETAVMFGELYRHSGSWKFRAIGQGFTGGLLSMAKNFGVNL